MNIELIFKALSMGKTTSSASAAGVAARRLSQRVFKQVDTDSTVSFDVLNSSNFDPSNPCSLGSIGDPANLFSHNI